SDCSTYSLMRWPVLVDHYKVTSLSIFINFSANLMVALLSLPMLARLGAASTFWIFAAICAVFVWFSFHVPETRGKSLEDVEHAFRQRHRERQRQASANSAGSGLSLARRAQATKRSGRTVDGAERP
uniref:MFS transporter n=1 Tax=Sodalis sp. (in: enterobacteria) TaxID=1898979 RepID=UPI003872D415